MLYTCLVVFIFSNTRFQYTKLWNFHAFLNVWIGKQYRHNEQKNELSAIETIEHHVLAVAPRGAPFPGGAITTLRAIGAQSSQIGTSRPLYLSNLTE
jgi:hypothetical protein